MSELLRCEYLTKRFGSVTALNNVNLSIESGRIVGLLGPNGARYILKVISTISAPTSTGIRA